MSTESRLIKLNFKPGINRESTEYAEEGSWYNGDKIRFRAGRPENLRGYSKRGAAAFDGTAVDLIAWTNNETYKFAAWGTEKKLYEYNSNITVDITPIKSKAFNTSAVVTVDGTNNGFYTVNTETTIIASISSHGAETGDFVTFTSSTGTIGGNQDLTGKTFPVSVINTNRFHFQVTAACNATQNRVGTATCKYLLPISSDVNMPGLGYGAGSYNTAREGGGGWNDPTDSSTIVNRSTQWSLDTYGEDLIACRRGGRIYYWNNTVEDSAARAGFVTASPTINNYILVSPNDRHLISFGSTEFGTGNYNPMLVRWSDQNNYNDFTPSISTTSGENILTDGTEIRGGIRARNAINIWTDNALWLMTFVGPPFVFKFQQQGSNCGLIGSHAAVAFNSMSFWMGDDNFYVFDGTVKVVDCTVRRYIFDDFNAEEGGKVYASTNSEFNEIIWLYPSANSTHCDRYVIFNPVEKTWSIGNNFWTTYEDKEVFGNTIATSDTSFLYDNEPADLYTADGAAQVSFIESAPFDIEDGNDMLFIDRLIPDFTLVNGNLGFTVKAQNFPVNDVVTKGPFTITPVTKKVDLRARGRQALVRVSSGDQGTEWRYGSLRLSLQEDGRR